jgi:hypothetical protein
VGTSAEVTVVVVAAAGVVVVVERPRYEPAHAGLEATPVAASTTHAPSRSLPALAADLTVLTEVASYSNGPLPALIISFDRLVIDVATKL